MLGRYGATVVVSMLIALSLASCATSPRQTELTVHIGQPVHYRSEDGDHFVARYGTLSDGSLHFVKVQMPSGDEYTLPQVVSASGVRYTDEKDLVWWTHQGTVLVDVRDAEGNWETKYSGLREVPEKN
jgi:membrane-bound inhibitor of C-type lysozyme